MVDTRWAPTSSKWSYNPYKWPYKSVTGVLTILIGVLTTLITGFPGPTLQLYLVIRDKQHLDGEKHCPKNPWDVMF